MGGTGVFIAIMSTLAIMWDNVEMNMQTRYVIGAISVMFLLGFTDDAIDLRASRKLFVMIIVASLVYMSGIRIDSLFGFFGVYGLPSGVSYAVHGVHDNSGYQRIQSDRRDRTDWQGA